MYVGRYIVKFVSDWNDMRIEDTEENLGGTIWLFRESTDKIIEIQKRMFIIYLLI